jgi:methylmalonyl-CoA mutase
VGVNTFLGKDHGGEITTTIELIRSTEDEKGQQITNVRACQGARNGGASDGLKPLQQTARKRENLFAALVEAVKTHSLGQISHALYEVGGEYRRNM